MRLRPFTILRLGNYGRGKWEADEGKKGRKKRKKEGKKKRKKDIRKGLEATS